MSKALASLAAFAAFAALGAASVNAAVVVIEINTGVPVGSGGAAAAGYSGWVVSLVSSTGNITAVDLSGPNGFQGPIVQRWTDPDGEGNYVSKTPINTAKNAGTTSNNNFDSHFLPPGGDAGNMLIASPLIEDAVIGPSATKFETFPTNTGLAGIGEGSFLRGAYGIAAAAQSPSLEIAYIVIDPRDWVPFTMLVATDRGGIERVSFGIGFPPDWPEPSGLAILGLSALGQRLAAGSTRARKHRGQVLVCIVTGFGTGLASQAEV